MKLNLSVAEIRKFLVAAIGVAAEAVSSGLLSGTAAHVASAVIAVATAAGVYVVPNATKAVAPPK